MIEICIGEKKMSQINLCISAEYLTMFDMLF